MAYPSRACGGELQPVGSRVSGQRGHFEEHRFVSTGPLLEFVDWQATKDGNVEVLNDTADYYRYFDATAHAEFLYRCVEQTIEKDLPEEVAYLESCDRFARSVQEIVDMPAEKIDLLHRFLRQEDGRLSKRAREGEFSALTSEEAEKIEALYRSSFANGERRPD